MVSFFKSKNSEIFAVNTTVKLRKDDIEKLIWLFSNSEYLDKKIINQNFIGPRKTMVTPWSTNAVEITQNMGIENIIRIEKFFPFNKNTDYDSMTSQLYKNLNQEIFKIDIKPDEIKEINNIKKYNEDEGLALSDDEVKYLENLSKKINRKLTDSEVFGFSQVNSEHCRHKIFNGTFIIENNQMSESLFELIKKTTKKNPNQVVSAYKDNVAFVDGPLVKQFAPKFGHKPSLYQETDLKL